MDGLEQACDLPHQRRPACAGHRCSGIDGSVASTLQRANERAESQSRARRVVAEHRVWVAMASFAGDTGAGYEPAAGCSRIWSAAGDTLAQVGPEPGLLARATIA